MALKGKSEDLTEPREWLRHTEILSDKLTRFLSLSLTTHGGTGLTTLTAHGVVLGEGASPAAVTAAGASNTVLHGVTGADPTFGAVVNGDIANATIDLAAKVTGTLPGANGGTGSANVTFAGPSVPRVLTLPDAATTLLSTNAAVTVPQGGTGVATLAAHGVVVGNAAGAVNVTGAGTTGQVLTGVTGADPTFQTLGVVLLDKSTTEQVVTNTVTPTSIYSFSVLGGTLGTNKTLRLTITGYYNNTSGGNSSLTVAGVYGATTFVTGSIQNSTNLTTGPFEMVVLLNANGTTNSQRAVATIRHVVDTVQVAVGAWSTMLSLNGAFYDALAEDSTAAKTLSVTVTHGVANANATFKRWLATLELVG